MPATNKAFIASAVDTSSIADIVLGTFVFIVTFDKTFPSSGSTMVMPFDTTETSFSCVGVLGTLTTALALSETLYVPFAVISILPVGTLPSYVPVTPKTTISFLILSATMLLSILAVTASTVTFEIALLALEGVIIC